jgi:basic membrane protein A and related proteins
LRTSRWSKSFAVALGLTLLAAACGDDDAATTDTTAASSGSAASDFTACQVTDTGGVDDKSFNETAYAGLVDAADELGFDPAFLESESEADFAPNIDAFLQDDCSMIVTVGFLLGDATLAAAQANPDTDFAIVDFAYDETVDNLLGLTFSTDQAAFLAGYVAAASTETGIIGTYGGIDIPTVTIFARGLEAGVAQYNEDNGTDVQVIGTDLFTGDFDNVENGRATTEQLLDQGADIIMPVAGPVGQGTIEAIRAGGGTQKVIWVDTDGCVSVPDACDLFLTSVMKMMDVAVHDAVVSAANGDFAGGVYSGTLENGGVGIAPFHDYEADVPQEVVDRIAELTDQIIAGDIEIPAG